MAAFSDQHLVLSSLITHVHMSTRKSFTLAESVMKPCMETAAREIHGGTTGCDLSAKTAIVHTGQLGNCTTQSFQKHVQC